MNPIIEMQEEILRLIADKAGVSTNDVAKSIDPKLLKQLASDLVAVVDELKAE